MTALDLASLLRRVEAIAANGRTVSLIDAGDALSITLMRLDALADDLRKGLHSSDAADAPDAGTYLQTGGEMA